MKKITTIYGPLKYFEQLNNAIKTEPRLVEVVDLIDYIEHKPVPSGKNLLIKEDEIWPLLDWYNVQPPFILPEKVEFNRSNFLGIVFAKLDNYEKAFEYLKDTNPTLFKELDFINRLQQGIPIDPQELISDFEPFDEYRLMHNQAIVRHYSIYDEPVDPETISYFYHEAIKCTPAAEYRAFTLRQFALFLMDFGQPEYAVELLQKTLEFEISAEARVAINHTICQAWMAQLTVPYDQKLLDALKEKLWNVLETYERQNRSIDQAVVLTDAGIIANYSESWTESLGYFNKALTIFDQEHIPELAANVHYRKGVLFYTWAQNGNPQFYKSAGECLQKAVRVFSKEHSPETYAEIQHLLGLIYAEIPDEAKKKSIWAAVSSSAFQEALNIFTKENNPYQYATLCNHYANALTKYPSAVQSDNIDKALWYYNEALSIRTPGEYPLERCLTLLNALEAEWNLGMSEDKFEKDRYQDMQKKANEVLTLSPDEELKVAASQHLDRLALLKQAYT